MSNETVRKGYNFAWQIQYHIVFPVKYRKALLDSEVTNIIQETSEEIAKRYPIEMEAIGYDKDHIHLLCGAHPKVAPGRIVQIFKSVKYLRHSRRLEICEPLKAVKNQGPPQRWRGLFPQIQLIYSSIFLFLLPDVFADGLLIFTDC